MNFMFKKKRKNKSFNYDSHKVIEKFVLLIQWKIKKKSILMIL